MLLPLCSECLCTKLNVCKMLKRREADIDSTNHTYRESRLCAIQETNGCVWVFGNEKCQNTGEPASALKQTFHSSFLLVDKNA